MLGHHTDNRGQLSDLMTDRLPNRLTIAEILPTAIAAHGRMLDRRVGVSDHLTMTALMPRLTTRLAPRAPTHRALWRLGRIARRRPRAIGRVLPQPPLKLLTATQHHSQPLTQRSVLSPQLPDLIAPRHAP